MTKEQEIRAYALAIAVLNDEGSFFKVLNGEKPIIEFSGQQKAYLKGIEAYITDGIIREVSTYGPELKNLVNYLLGQYDKDHHFLSVHVSVKLVF